MLLLLVLVLALLLPGTGLRRLLSRGTLAEHSHACVAVAVAVLLWLLRRGTS